MLVHKQEISSTAGLNDTYLDAVYSHQLNMHELARGPFTYDELSGLYTKSELGGHHFKQPLRFPNYDYHDRPQQLADLGQNICPVGHMRVAYDNASLLLDAEALDNPRRLIRQFTPYDIQVIRLTARLHDIGENTHPSLGKTVGDIPYGKKTDADRQVEQNVRKQIWKQLYGMLPVSLVTEMDDLIAHRNRDDPREHASEASHLIGELETALYAGSTALDIVMTNGNTDSLRFKQLHRLSKSVLLNTLDRLTGKYELEQFTFVRQTIDKNKLLIRDIECEL